MKLLGTALGLSLAAASGVDAWTTAADLPISVPLADVLGDTEVLQNPIEIRLGDEGSAELLRAGWAVPERWPGEALPAVWGDAPASELRIRVAEPRPTRVTIDLAPLHCEPCPPQSVRVGVNGTIVATFTLPPGGFRPVTFDVPGHCFRFGENTLSLAWGWRRVPSEIEPGSSDHRSLAAAVSRVRFEPLDGRRALPRTLPAATPAGELLLPAGQARTLLLEVPPGVLRVSGRVARDGHLSTLGASVRASMSVAWDGRGEEPLAVVAMGGLASAPRPFYGELRVPELRVLRISLRAEGDAEAVARFSEVAIGLPPGTELATALGRYQARGSAGTAPAPSPNHVLLFLMDALRARDLGCYGSLEVTSPFVDRLSREGLLLARNVSQAPNTPPSVKALLTGRYLPQTGNLPLPVGIPTLGELFAARGYRTGAFSNSPWPGAVGALRGIAHVAPGLFFEEGQPKNHAERLARALAAWVRERPEEPFFAYAHAIHPHNPYAPPPPFRSPAPLEGSTQLLLDAQHGARTLSPAELAALGRLYREDILFADFTVGLLVRELVAAGIWGATVVAVVSDHGEEHGEHGGLLHGWTPYDEMIQTPVVIRARGFREGAVRAGLSETVDVAPTLLTLAGVPVPPGLDGRAVDAGGGLVAAHCSASSAPGIYTLVRGRHKYVYAPRREEVGIGEGTARVRERFFLFDLDADPREQRNVVRDHPILARFLHRSLLAWLQATGDGTAPPAEGDACPGCDEETRRLLKQLGYLN